MTSLVHVFGPVPRTEANNSHLQMTCRSSVFGTSLYYPPMKFFLMDNLTAFMEVRKLKSLHITTAFRMMIFKHGLANFRSKAKSYAGILIWNTFQEDCKLIRLFAGVLKK